MYNKMWDEITYSFTNLNGFTVEVWEWKSYFIPHYTWNMITYPCWDYNYRVEYSKNYVNDSLFVVYRYRPILLQYDFNP